MDKPERRTWGGLNPREPDSVSAARRVGVGRPSDEERAGEVLPFEATLAYVFRTSGGKTAAINAARLLEETDPRFKRFTYAWDSASESDRKSLRLEDLCGGADLSPDEFLAKIIPALWQRNTDISRVIAAIAHPQVVAASIEVATSSGTFGATDRKMLLEASGFLPTKQGSTINIDASHKSVTMDGKTKEIEGPGMPAFAEDITEYAGVIRGDTTPKLLFNGQPLLPAATLSQSVDVPIDAEIEEIPSVQSLQE